MNRPQAIALTSAPNARELGGYQITDGRVIQSGKLLRTGLLNTLTEQECALLHEEYNLSCIFDFRDQEEVSKLPDAVPQGAVHHFLPVIESADNPAAKAAIGITSTKRVITPENMQKFAASIGGPEGVARFMENTYRSIALSPVSAAAYTAFLDLTLSAGESGGAVLFHCTAGKDRTGVAAALLLTALGASRETILNDYLLTNVYLTDAMTVMVAGTADPALTSQIGPLLGVQESYLDAYYEEIEAHHGSVIAYIENILHFSTEKQRRLQNAFTTAGGN